MRRTFVRTLAAVGIAAAATLGAAVVAPPVVTTPVASAATAVTSPEAPPRPQAGPPCAPGNLCVFSEPNFTGARTDFFTCTRAPVDIRPKLARAGSYINNQFGSQVAEFYGDFRPGTPPQPAFRSTAVDARADTTATVIHFVKAC